MATAALVLGLAGPGMARDAGRGFGRMGPVSARVVSVSPSSGPDFELPFTCGTRWTGSTRSSHSPSSYTVDFNAPGDLDKPVLASAPGRVVLTRSLTTSYGRYVIVDHGGGFTTLYAHLNRISVVTGQMLDQGDLVGHLGTSGNSTGPHLHFEQRRDGAYFRPYFHRRTWSMGSTSASLNCNDRPVTGDWDGDGVSDVGIYRTSSSGGRFYLRAPSRTTTIAWGTAADVPAVDDYDGDDVAQVGVRKRGSSTWHLRSRSGARATVNGVGVGTDTPMTGDWDGNGRANLGFYRFSNRTFYLRSEAGKLTPVRWGQTGDLPVSGDWNHDRRSDVGSFDPGSGVWTLRVPSRSTFTTASIRYGKSGDLPAVGDWNGDGVTDLGIWRPSTRTFWKRTPQVDGSFRSVTQAYGSAR